MGSVVIIAANRPIRNSLKEMLQDEQYVVNDIENIQSVSDVLKKEDVTAIIHYNDDKHNTSEALIKYVIKSTTTIPIVAVVESNDQASFDKLNKHCSKTLMKPVTLAALLKAFKSVMAEREQETQKEEAVQESNPIDIIIGDSQKIEHIKNMIKVVAPCSETRVLITGENGTGKELVAKSLHALSNRKEKPFIEVNCAAIPRELIESELFGHEKGSFTSADRRKKGKFEEANGGTLFLDEIGDMALAAQAKVLRVLQEKKLTRVGGEGEIKIDVRIVSATNKNLIEEIHKGTFREDLYHRISVVEIKVPPLRERPSDIPLLATAFAREICNNYRMEMKEFSPEVIELLKQRQWTGNVRELHNIVERLIIFSKEIITVDIFEKYVLNP